MTAQNARRSVTRLPRARRVRDIMNAARAVFAERGYEDAAMSEIAARAGVVEGTIYKYFDSKRSLLYEIMANWYQSMVADYEEALSGIQGTRNRLRFVVWRHLKYVYDNPALCRVFFREIRSAGDYHQSRIYEMNRLYTHFANEILRDGVARGEFREDINVSLVRDMIYGAIEHHSWNYVCGRGTLDVDAVADALTDTVLGGIAAAPPSDSLGATAARLEAVAERLERRAAE